MDSREQFEEWVKMIGPEPDLTRANSGLNYANSEVDIAWLVWKASRKAIEIQEPHFITSKEALAKGYMIDYSNGFGDGMDAYEANIKEAGITVKGE